MHRKKGRVNRPEALRRRVVSRLGSILKSSPLSLKTRFRKKKNGNNFNVIFDSRTRHAPHVSQI